MAGIYAVVLILLFGSNTDQALAAADPEHVQFSFAGVVGKEAFACGRSYEGIGTSRSRITPTDFRFYVSDVQLLRTDGSSVPLALDQDGTWQAANVALLDFEDGSGPCRNGNSGLNSAVSGTAPKDTYTGIRFTLGLPFELNHQDQTRASSPLNFSALFWVWQTGYKFVKIDLSSAGQPDRSQDMRPDVSMKDSMAMSPAVGFPVHLGSAGCVSKSMTDLPTTCARPNRVTVTLDQFDVTQDVVVADIEALLSGTDVDRNTPDTAPGCMSETADPDCVAVMRAFGLDSSPQSFFRVR